MNDQTANITAAQLRLKALGLYTGMIDGIAGDKTWGGVLKALDVATPPTTPPPVPTTSLADIDERSAGVIATVADFAQPYFIQLVKAATAAGIDARAISGYRTYSEQEKLYEDYIHYNGPQAAPPGQSNHNFALAVDMGIFDDRGRYIDEVLPEKEISRQYTELGKIGKSLGLIWGGDWHGSDQPHFEFRPAWAKDLSEAAALAEYRARHARGESLA